MPRGIRAREEIEYKKREKEYKESMEQEREENIKAGKLAEMELIELLSEAYARPEPLVLKEKEAIVKIIPEAWLDVITDKSLRAVHLTAKPSCKANIISILENIKAGQEIQSEEVKAPKYEDETADRPPLYFIVVAGDITFTTSLETVDLLDNTREV